MVTHRGLALSFHFSIQEMKPCNTLRLLLLLLSNKKQLGNS